MKNLIITNGDAAAEKMREARINGEILCWRDILHEGPVPRRPDTLEEFSAIRVGFLAGGGWGDPEEIARSPSPVRDGIMRDLRGFPRSRSGSSMISTTSSSCCRSSIFLLRDPRIHGVCR